MEKKEVPKGVAGKTDSPSFGSLGKGKILEELKLMAAGRQEHGKVSAMINCLPAPERKAALVKYLEGSFGHNTVDAIDFNIILEGVKIPEAERRELVERYQKRMHD